VDCSFSVAEIVYTSNKLFRKQRDNLKAQLEVKKQELELVVGEIPSTKDVSSVCKKLGAIASESGVRILSINPAKPNEVNYALEKVQKEER
jgi:hypothetical protein